MSGEGDKVNTGPQGATGPGDEPGPIKLPVQIVSHPRSGGPGQSKTIVEMANELNSSSGELQNEVPLLTSDFLRSDDREALHTKKLELQTLLSVYKSEYEEIMKRELNAQSRELLKNQFETVKKYEQQITKFFADVDAFDIRNKEAADQVYELKKLFERIEDFQGGVTEDVLRLAFMRDFERLKSEATDKYMKFTEKYLTLNLDNRFLFNKK